MTRSYNGYKNWETWLTYTWLTNDENVYNILIGRAETFHAITGEKMGRGLFADYLEGFLTERLPDISPPLYNVLLRGTLKNIDYKEIAGHLLAECKSPPGEENG